MFRRLGWRHLIWFIVLAGITYVCLPVFYAADYTWGLLHPACAVDSLDGVDGEWIELTDEVSGSFKFWYSPPENGRVIVLIGGRGGTLSNWQVEVESFQSVGYGVAVLPDPGCNLPAASLGIKEADQISSVVRYLAAEDNVNWIGAAGFSAGASALALAVPSTEQLQAVVLMGNFADLKSEILYTPYKTGSVGWLGQQAVPYWYRLFAGKRVRDVSPVSAFEEYEDINVLLIFGEYEVHRTQAEGQFEALQESVGEHAKLWIIPGAVHGMYYEAAGQIYLERLIAFFEGEDESLEK